LSRPAILERDLSEKEDRVSQLVFDEDTGAQLEALYATADAVRRRRIVRETLAAARGQRILDVGCGPGFYCAELAEEVGSTGSVVGLDSSPAMLALARRRCAVYDNVELAQAEAVSLPVEDGSADAALSVQVLEYVADVNAALAEMYRALRPGGRIVVWDVDWATVSYQSEDEARTQRVLHAWDEHLAHPSLPRTLAARLRAVGFEDVSMDAHAFATIELDPERYGAVLLPLIEAFVAGREGVTESEAKAWAAEQRALGERGEFYVTTTQLCFGARKPP
jgi:arsenite methyltransferase